MTEQRAADIRAALSASERAFSNQVLLPDVLAKYREGHADDDRSDIELKAWLGERVRFLSDVRRGAIRVRFRDADPLVVKAAADAHAFVARAKVKADALKQNDETVTALQQQALHLERELHRSHAAWLEARGQAGIPDLMNQLDVAERMLLASSVTWAQLEREQIENEIVLNVLEKWKGEPEKATGLPQRTPNTGWPS
jgi:hypothetical protein